jgi:hypothetical protein
MHESAIRTAPGASIAARAVVPSEREPRTGPRAAGAHLFIPPADGFSGMAGHNLSEVLVRVVQEEAA